LLFLPELAIIEYRLKLLLQRSPIIIPDKYPVDKSDGEKA